MTVVIIIEVFGISAVCIKKAVASAVKLMKERQTKTSKTYIRTPSIDDQVDINIEEEEDSNSGGNPR